MSTVKEEAADLVEQLPENATWDDLMYRIYVHQKLSTERRLTTVRERQETADFFSGYLIGGSFTTE